MKKLFKLFILLMLVPLLFSGCWNYTDINRRSVNLCISIDEKDNQIKFGGEIAKLNTTNIEKEKAELTDVYTLNAYGDFFEFTRANYDNKNISSDFSGALRAVVFSKNYASNHGIESYINRLHYMNQFRNSVLVSISDISTEELFSAPIENDISIGYSIENTISHLSDSGSALYKSVQQIVSDMRFKNIGYLLPYITRSNDTIKYLGLAVMRDSKMVGVILSEDSTGVLFLVSKKPTAILLIPHPNHEDNSINAKVLLNKREINTSFKDEHVIIDIDLSLTSEIMYEYKMSPLSNDDLKDIENYISNKIKNDVLATIIKSKKEFKCDIFEFARYFKASNYKKYKDMDWSKEYENSHININVKTTVKHSNVLDPNAKVPTSKK